MRFRKKPVVVEAWEFTEESWMYGPAPKWVLAAVQRRDLFADSVTGIGACLRVRTLEGVHIARLGDWIIKGVQGEIYPCKPDIFRETYEPVE